MRLDELNASLFELPRLSQLYRVQRLRARPGSVAIGPLRLPPVGLMVGRFDLVEAPVAYLATSPDTAIFETWARREARIAPFDALTRSGLLEVATLSGLTLLDLRHETNAYPVLQSIRWHETQELAAEAHARGLQGLIYSSAQQLGGSCVALFDLQPRSLKLIEKLPLVDPTGKQLLRVAAHALDRAKIPVVR